MKTFFEQFHLFRPSLIFEIKVTDHVKRKNFDNDKIISSYSFEVKLIYID